jgi:hypothetical protein
MDTKIQYIKVIESVKLLALPFEEQLNYFPEFVEVPFEVIDTFDNALLQLPLLIESGYFEKRCIASLLRLQNLINFTSSQTQFKDLEVEQFKMAEEWNKVRQAAKETLRILEVPLEKPDAYYI